MQSWIRILLVASCASCASGRSDVTVVADAASTDSTKPAIDAPITTPDAAPDAPPQSATCTQPFTGVLASWVFTAEAGGQASTVVATKAPGITAGAITRSAALTAVTGAGSINASNWATAATRDLTKYYTFSITPPAGCKLALTSGAVDAHASGTGPSSVVIATSADNYAISTALSTTTASSPALAVANATTPIEVRVYGYGATAAGGTLRLQTTLSLTGSLQ